MFVESLLPWKQHHKRQTSFFVATGVVMVVVTLNVANVVVAAEIVSVVVASTPTTQVFSFSSVFETFVLGHTFFFDLPPKFSFSLVLKQIGF
jgi:hypothetical protein